MNDFKTRDIASYVLRCMGFKLMAENVQSENSDIDMYIKFIKFKSKKFNELNDLVNHFL